MANIGDVLGGVGSTLTDYAQAKEAQQLNQEAYTEHLQDRAYQKQDEDLTLQERGARLAALRQAAMQNSPEIQALKAQAEKAEREARANMLEASGLPQGKIAAALVRAGIDPPASFFAAPKPERPIDPKMQQWSDLIKQYPGIDTPRNRLAFFGMEKKEGEGVSSPIATKAEELARAKKALASGDKVGAAFWGIKESPEEKNADIAKRLMAPKLKANLDAKTAVEDAEKLNNEWARKIGPLVGHVEMKNWYRSADAQRIINAFARLIPKAVAESNAGSRGYTKYEQSYFKQLIPSVTNTPEQNQAIIDNWKHDLDTDRTDWGLYGASMGVDMNSLAPLMGSGAGSVEKWIRDPKSGKLVKVTQNAP